MTARAVTLEADYQRTVCELLDRLGWAWTHTYPLRTKHGWRTGTTAKGFPDLLAVRGAWLVAIEVKSDTGRPTGEQREWLDRFSTVAGGRAWLIRPADPDFQRLAEWLMTPRVAPRTYGLTATSTGG